MCHEARLEAGRISFLLRRCRLLVGFAARLAGVGVIVCVAVAGGLISPWTAAADDLEGVATHAISGRIGSEIDKQERDYFGLFPDLDGFVQARTYRNPGDTVVVVAQWERSGATGDSTITLDQATASELRRYINEFEAVISNKTTARWDAIYDVAKQPAMNLDKKGRATKVVVKGGAETAGELLFASEEMLLLWQGNLRYSWDSSATCLKAFAPSEIKEVRIDTGTNAGTAMLVGAGAGFAIGIAVMTKIDASNWDEPVPEGSTYYCARDYFIVSGILAGAGLVGGFLYGAARGSEDEYDVGYNPSAYAGHLKEIKKKAFFRGAAPPEFREYSEAGYGEVKPK